MLCRPTIGREGFLLLCIIALSLYTFRLHTESNNGFYNTQAPASSRWTLQDRLKLSENFYAETLKRRKALIEAYPGDTIPLFAAVNAKTYRETPYSVWDLIPAAYNCPWDIQRVGRMGDGGKWVCGLARYENRKNEECVIYSFGVRDESSFEEEMLERTNCGVWAYDPAVAEFGPQLSKKYVEQGRAKFVQAALGPVTKVNGKMSFYSLKKLMEMNGHEYIDFLKMDIEFAEFDSMTAFLEDFAGQKLPIGQFLVEIHLFKSKITTEKFLQWWEALEQRGLRPVWTEPNLIYVTQHLSDSMPRLAEYTLLNIDNNKNPLLFE